VSECDTERGRWKEIEPIVQMALKLIFFYKQPLVRSLLTSRQITRNILFLLFFSKVHFVNERQIMITPANPSLFYLSLFNDILLYCSPFVYFRKLYLETITGRNLIVTWKGSILRQKKHPRWTFKHMLVKWKRNTTEDEEKGGTWIDSKYTLCINNKILKSSYRDNTNTAVGLYAHVATDTERLHVGILQ
jgi:hypothetical protein